MPLFVLQQNIQNWTCIEFMASWETRLIPLLWDYTHQTDPIRQYLETRPSLVYHLYRNIQYWILQPFTRNKIHVIMRQKSQSKPLTNLKTNNRTEKNIMKSERGTLHLKRQKSHLCQTRFCWWSQTGARAGCRGQGSEVRGQGSRVCRHEAHSCFSPSP